MILIFKVTVPTHPKVSMATAHMTPFILLFSPPAFPPAKFGNKFAIQVPGFVIYRCLFPCFASINFTVSEMILYFSFYISFTQLSKILFSSLYMAANCIIISFFTSAKCAYVCIATYIWGQSTSNCAQTAFLQPCQYYFSIFLYIPFS